jgi:hypothetical protein
MKILNLSSRKEDLFIFNSLSELQLFLDIHYYDTQNNLCRITTRIVKKLAYHWVWLCGERN